MEEIRSVKVQSGTDIDKNDVLVPLFIERITHTYSLTARRYVNVDWLRTSHIYGLPELPAKFASHRWGSAALTYSAQLI